MDSVGVIDNKAIKLMRELKLVVMEFQIAKKSAIKR